ncbi:MAG: hypothetical protein IPF69_10645 [Chitinophagaceae bacterium]|jgi:hypothetical protein|nr:hypothetical protein [Chitinophagaceae bacterium]MBK7679442.1 hypothetical protein [Chitinophagaceae bacterium]MBK8299210.1 hypothetical protein [Chitinophagaceae bacterium]MBK9463262.1 hypothetical protein [Chitinophagaceae bacterium]MBK9659612.1 hypothetical protein [Chitinophagaceae bacterium]
MQKTLLIFLLLFSLSSRSQSVFGYWYGDATVKIKNSANNYLVELILQPEKNYVKGVLNYYFKDTYRSLQVKGNYNAATRQLVLYDIPVVYHASISSFEVDCMMNFQATLRVAQAGSDLVGAFISLPEYKNMCPTINTTLHFNTDISKKDSVLKAISEYKEEYQVWKPSATDTLVAVNITPRKVVNYVTESEYTKRENVVTHELEAESDMLKLDIYDNGEIDGDIISVFFNKQLILSNQKLTHKSIHIDIPLDTTKTDNEISMFAENLGLIPPNTALMVITDGKKKYEIRLASNLEKNATIRIRRKKN